MDPRNSTVGKICIVFLYSHEIHDIYGIWSVNTIAIASWSLRLWTILVSACGTGINSSIGTRSTLRYVLMCVRIGVNSGIVVYALRTYRSGCQDSSRIIRAVYVYMPYAWNKFFPPDIVRGEQKKRLRTVRNCTKVVAQRERNLHSKQQRQ